mmetsp:Transcript_9200/g.27706  ORF Transcript_9200/g.27706 Transcript_9200/m.27706 type:complete len:277 (-) Transcript_9200:1415-2245(-)|eukprot:CAMPEP_0198732802 /NCGR_PEP_ID=MMETSP1475-20131203/39578_1 /TAXON_ID= ORGANISM="Unidentified sp., Strain CCMP1999" /NCGR_SAMPLE_ID=MMETSP1475 /ASSEMBLY_ACC=CAM_ASM_001111 /LENGTH=276 /DNA_ID=CAMNT_0044495977 /DNA_START=53 /DNA_END=883 /DNA_ORIENTATION=-
MDGIEKFVQAHKEEAELLENGKVRCTVTGHELVSNIDVLNNYWSGKALQKARRRSKQTEIDLKEFLPFIVTDKTQPEKFVVCTLTSTRLNRDEKEIRNHIQGRKFKHHKREAETKRRKEEKRKEQKNTTEDTNMDEEDSSGNDAEEGAEHDLPSELDDSDSEYTAEENAELPVPAADESDDGLEEENQQMAQKRKSVRKAPAESKAKAKTSANSATKKGKKARLESDDGDVFWVRGRSETRAPEPKSSAGSKRKANGSERKVQKKDKNSKKKGKLK